MHDRPERTPDFCFVLVPQGVLTDRGRPVDCDAVFADVLAPGVAAAGLDPVRLAPREVVGDAADRLGLFRLGVAERTTASPQLMHAIGRWEGWRGTSAVLVAADGEGADAAGCDVACALDDAGRPADPAASRERLAAALAAQRARGPAPALCHLLDGAPPSLPERYKTDLFRERIIPPAPWGEALRDARRAGIDAVRAVAARMEPLHALHPAAAIDLLLSYRAVSGWGEMVDLAESLPPALARMPMVAEQRALALNRLGRVEAALHAVHEVLSARGPSSETLGVLGRIYKDQIVRDPGPGSAADGALRSAIEAYTRGFEADPRDLYPGINAVTLMELAQPPDPRRKALLPVIEYVLRLRIARGEADYWDLATALEVAVLRRDPGAARAALANALAVVREPWEPGTTAENLRRIQRARAARGEHDLWLAPLVQALEAAAAPTPPSPGAPA